MSASLPYFIEFVAVLLVAQSNGKAYRLEKSLLEPPLPEPPRSWLGEPAPERGVPDIMLDEDSPPTSPKGGLEEEPDPGGSMGELLAEGDAERGWLGGCEE